MLRITADLSFPADTLLEELLERSARLRAQSSCLCADSAWLHARSSQLNRHSKELQVVAAQVRLRVQSIVERDNDRC